MNHFDPDPKLQEIAGAYGLDMVEFANRHFRIDLDWSDKSVEQIESIADVLHKDYRQNSPPEKKIEPFYKMLGSYVGEVLRRNHGAEWGWVTLQGERFAGMRDGSEVFWPWGRAKDRIVNGVENNIWHYFLRMVSLRESNG